ncbi:MULTISPECIES: ABC transporter ATP-binding protein [Clostridium]|jgi:putative ABC transport system ATP-binding protein|uniref:ABC transporter ATP-binding protein n=2 Tax=Clostridiaceae TaxID=31979 RepID=UPI00232CA837|nr:MULTISPECIES: ABC transporter ATP-binding protein [Clostridium]MDB2104205.1 ABC transporter ATP-binding protein [Clostridium paraputrificum]MDU1825115.1 ABC transporter ATP-binding protein [Clostridium sp.]MDU1841242.1 ABC transporter ATP-binding protein [Clostridium sp.]MDU2689947.1 ABC transporter ATP-binding protein [Clostridium sp.]MDU2957732.1 ABC transporter ATP-binding protein [Clostridium sp.]
MSELLIGKNIKKSYGEGNEKQVVLDNVSVSIKTGEFISIMGPSGSGKSTLMYVLSGMDVPEGGNVTFDGDDLAVIKEKDLAEIRRTKMGFIFQQPSLLKNLNIGDNIILTSVRSNRKNIKDILIKADNLMKMTGIENLKNRNINEVSGGQLQRAGICRSLMNDPKIIFGDEPTGALNSKSAEEIMDLLRHINNKGTTIVLVTHDPKVASKTERIMFMSDGKIQSELKLSKYDGKDIDERMEKVLGEMKNIGI